MRFYKTVADDGEERMVKWGGTQSEAVAARKEFAAGGFGRKEVSTVEEDVPTDKAGLLAWLIENVKE